MKNKIIFAVAVMIAIFIFQRVKFSGSTPVVDPAKVKETFSLKEVTPEKKIQIATRTDAVTPADPQVLKIAQLKLDNLRDKIASSLPEKKSLKWKKEVQESAQKVIPTSVLELGRNFGRINSIAIQFPELRKEVEKIYGDCVVNTAITDAVRVTCLSNYRRFAAPKNKNDLDQSIEESIREQSAALSSEL